MYLGEKKDKEPFVVPSIYLQQKKVKGQLKDLDWKEKISAAFPKIAI